MKKPLQPIFTLLLSLLFALAACAPLDELPTQPPPSAGASAAADAAAAGTGTPTPASDGAGDVLSEIPEYSGAPYVAVNDNVPFFTEEEITTDVFEDYSPLDSLGRCGVAYANICRGLMPTEKRESISSVRPTGWHSVEYDFVNGKSLYNRCHLIGFQLAGENANERNLITGTRYLNIEGMLPFEDMVADYVKETDGHVLYRVTPYFRGDNLVANGVLMEGWSVEDEGDGVCFNVYAYNVQPGVSIDYATGDNWAAPADGTPTASESYVLNTNSKKFHTPGCASVPNISANNRQEFSGSRDELIAQGYAPCGSCNP